LAYIPSTSTTAFIGYTATTDSTTVIYTTPFTTLTANNFVGYSASSYTDGQTATIKTLGSVASGLTGLTAAQTYYVTATGSLSLTADTPSVRAGRALSSTQLLVTL
jgi:hypothetical protein